MRPFRPARVGAIATTYVLAASLLSLTTSAPASAHGDAERNRRVAETTVAEAPSGLSTTGPIAQLGTVPGDLGISGCFLESRPIFVLSGLGGLSVFDVSDGAAPTRVGFLDSAQFENEAMTCGERRTRRGTRRFALVGLDLFQASTTDPQHVNVGGSELVVVDVTTPSKPRIIGRTPGTTSTHTVACVRETDCRFAYSAGDDATDRFSIFDLRRPGRPRELDSNPRRKGIQAFASPTAGHKWNFDQAGVATHTGFDGSSMWDVRKPRRPRLLATTGKAGRGDHPDAEGYNDFIHHNSFRPHARAFRPRARPRLRNGNVLLVTEEDYEETDCTKAGSFQTWWVKRLNGRPGGIVPLDKVELADLGTYPPAQLGDLTSRGAFCSSHWFDYRAGGIVAAGFYGGGTQILDVRNPRRITSYASSWWGVSEVWDAMWLPVYQGNRRTNRSTNVVYSIDLVRGLDVYAVDLPGDGRSGAVPYDGVSSRAKSGSSAAATLPLGLVVIGVGGALWLRRRVHRRTP